MTRVVVAERSPELEAGSRDQRPAPPRDPTGRRRPWYLRPPRLVLVATATFAVLTGLWSVLAPLTEAPDEPAHLGLVLYVAETGHYPAYDGLRHTAGLFQLCVDFATTANWCRTTEERVAGISVRERPSAEEAPPKDERPRWDDPAFRALKPGRWNQMPQHPPLYYVAMANALRLERAIVPGELSVDTELAFLRLVNVFVVLPIPWLAWCAARRLGAGDEVGMIAALLPLTIPQVTHIGGTLNNDNLFAVLGCALLALLVGVARGDRSRSTAVLVGLTTGLALLTKGFGVVLPVAVALAYWIGSGSLQSSRRTWRRAWAAGYATFGSLAVVFAISGWWYVGNLVRSGHIMPSIEDRGRLSSITRPAGFHPQLDEYVGSTVARLVKGFWGAFGWRQVELPAVASVVATLLCLAAVIVAFGARSRPAESGPPIARVHLVLLLGPITMLAGFVVIRSAVIYADVGRLAFQQGRYLFAGLTGAAVVIALGIHRMIGGRAAVPVTALGVFLMQGLAVVACLIGWWSMDRHGLQGALRALVAWSGWPDPVVIAMLAVVPVQLTVLAWTARRLGARETVRAAVTPAREPGSSP